MSKPTDLQRRLGDSGTRSFATEVDDLEFMAALPANGFTDARFMNGRLHAVKRFTYTTAIVVGVDAIGYERRYCFEQLEDAQAALRAWDGHGHPPGPWIKCKGTGIDLLNPELR
jgi:hypothetical protein